MEQRTFSIKEALSFGWTSVKNYFFYFAGVSSILLGLTIILGIFRLISSSLPELVRATVKPSMWLIIIDIILFSSMLLLKMIKDIISAGLKKMIMNIYDDREVEFNDIILDWNVIKKLIIFYVVYGIAIFSYIMLVIIIVTLIGALLPENILFIIVGVFLFLGLMYIVFRLFFAEYFIVDREIGYVDAIKYSFNLSKGLVIKFLLFSFLLLLINLLGVILGLGIGFVFFTGPLSSAALVSVYRQLIEQIELAED